MEHQNNVRNQFKSLHKKSTFPLRISSVNVTKPQFPVDLVAFTQENFNGKFHFLCSEFNNEDSRRCHWESHLSVFIVNSEEISNIVLMFPLLTLKKFQTLFSCFHCWLWTSKCELRVDQLCWMCEMILHLDRFCITTSSQRGLVVKIFSFNIFGIFLAFLIVTPGSGPKSVSLIQYEL